jgi:adenine-specific DNA-methyltransferase
MYLGSKDKLTDFILQVIKEKAPNAKTVIDVFTGTTRVSQVLRANGYNGFSSDLSWASEVYAGCFLQNENNNHLLDVIEYLNNLSGYEGWLSNNYGDVGDGDKKVRVWQRKNSMKADAIRDEIEKLPYIGWEKNTLITSLIMALQKVDNTVGVQQAYLKDWCKRSYNDLVLKLPFCFSGSKWEHFSGDALKIDYPEADIAYLDPPYTAHSYSTYYHIWDSIARWDKPEVMLKTNRRADRCFSKDSCDKNMLSGWNYKNTVLSSFDSLIKKLKVNDVFISYNNEGLVSKEEMNDMFEKHGKVSITAIDYKKNIMTKIGNGSTDDACMENIEYIYHINKSP